MSRHDVEPSACAEPAPDMADEDVTDERARDERARDERLTDEADATEADPVAPPPPRSTPLDDLVDLPRDRLGEFLRRTRLSNGDPLPTIARQLSWHFTPTVLRMIESGEYPLTPEDLDVVLGGYRVDDVDDLLGGRSRLEVDIDNARMVSGAYEWRLATTEKIPNVLLEYVRFVREMRRLPPGATVPGASIRHEDLEVLASSLGTTPEAIEASVRAIVAPHSVTADDVALIARACAVTTETVGQYLAALTGGDRHTSPDLTDTGQPGTHPCETAAGAGSDEGLSFDTDDTSVDLDDTSHARLADGPEEDETEVGPLRGRQKKGLLARLVT